MSSTRLAAAPFDAADADVILRTASPDPTDFRVHRLILSLSSPFFQTTFSLPNAPHNGEDEIPVIDIAESSEVLDTLLRAIYPVHPPDIHTLDKLGPILEAAIKYDMASVLQSLRNTVITPSFLNSSPLRVYAMAARYDFEEEMKVASRATLNNCVLEEPLCDDLKFINGQALFRLLSLHHRRTKAIKEAFTTFSLTLTTKRCPSALCQKWWADFKLRAFEEVAERPTTKVIFSLSFLNLNGENRTCGAAYNPPCAMRIPSCLEELKQQIDDLPDTV